MQLVAGDLWTYLPFFSWSAKGPLLWTMRELDFRTTNSNWLVRKPEVGLLMKKWTVLPFDWQLEVPLLLQGLIWHVIFGWRNWVFSEGFNKSSVYTAQTIWVPPGLKLTQINFCRINTANRGLTPVKSNLRWVWPGLCKHKPWSNQD